MKVGNIDISYASDTGKDYQHALDEADTLPKLRKTIELYSGFAPDALAKIKSRRTLNFTRWRCFLEGQRNGNEHETNQNLESFGAVLLPATILHIGLIAERFNAPFGCAAIRCIDVGLYEIKDGVLVKTKKELAK